MVPCPLVVAQYGRGCALRFVYKFVVAQMELALNMGFRAEKEANDGKKDVCCITNKG